MAGAVQAEKIIGQWWVPLKGTLRGLPPYALPEDALYDSLNVVVRAGAVIPRPGLTKFDPTVLGGRPVGAFSTTEIATGAFQEDAFQNDAFQIVGNTPTSVLLVITPTTVWTFWGGIWHDITGTPLTGQESAFARATSIQIGTTINVIITNGSDTPQVWDSVAATVSPLAGSPPKWTDITTASDRIIGIVPPYLVRWGNSLDLTTWPSANFRSLGDTVDPVVAVRNLGTLGVVVYKQRSIWIGSPNGVTDATYFSFSIRGFWDGPASPAAVVDVDGANYYMTDTGRMAYFDGTQHEWIGDGVWPAVQDELDQPNSGRIFGVFEPTNREVYFYYPRTGDGGACRGMAIIKVPRPAEGIPQPIAFRGLSSIPLSCGTDTRLDTRRALVLGDATQIAYTIEGANDDGTNFAGFFQPGFVAVPGLDPYRLEGFEVFCERGIGYGTLTPKVVSNNLLEAPDTASNVAAQVINLAEIVPQQPEGADVTGKFFALRFEFLTPITLKWYGARLAARRIEPGIPIQSARTLRMTA